MKIYDLRFKIYDSKGFTLIELLIVIVIIGILSSVLLSNFIGVRQRARDGTRKSDLRQMQSALELYRADNGAYPVVDVPVQKLGDCGAAFLPIGTTYMAKIPCDPLRNPNVAGPEAWNVDNYYYKSDGSTYTLAACLENTGDQDPNIVPSEPTGAAAPACSSAKYFVLTNP